MPRNSNNARSQGLARDSHFPDRVGGRQVATADLISGPGHEGPQDLSLDPYAGGTFRNLPILDLEGVIGQIATGSTVHAPNGVITYTFLDGRLTGLYNNPNYGFTAGFGLAPFTQEQRAEARDSIELWDDLIPQSFRETNGRGADIQFSNSQDPAQAYAYYPINGRGWKFQSDVFIADPEVNWTNAWLGFGGYGATTLVHELGHALGLSHPGNYNYDPNLPLSYANYAEYAQDSEQYTIMSYWGMEQTSNQVFAGGVVDFNTLFYNNPQTPLVHDILAIQAQYGADPTTRATDTVYGYNSTAGNEVYDFTVNEYPYLAIYDAGGIDTIDMSGANASVYINLNEGAFSSGAEAIPTAAVVNANRAELAEIAGPLGPVSQATMDYYASVVPNTYASIIAAETGVTGIRTTSHDNLAIAYGTVIENAIGSAMRDLLVGNEVDNVLTGLAGNDVLRGGGGDDTLIGGAGADTLTGGAGADLFVATHAFSTDVITDFESGVDQIDLSAFDFTFVGENAFSNTAGELRFADGQLQGDLNGDGVADLFLTVQGDPIIGGDLIL